MLLQGFRRPRFTRDKLELGNNAVVVEGLSKRFRIPQEKKRTVYENLIGLFQGRAGNYEEFSALNDVSFSVKRGETFGVIGPNGCGKSTLLKVLAGVLYPDDGRVMINGKIAPFLELGVGFQPELSARDNVYLYGAIMGLTGKEVSRRYEEIMDFAELKRFENMKLRNFSSGMYVRLAFATAIHTDPEIMLVDEVLSVGDEAFQNSAIRPRTTPSGASFAISGPNTASRNTGARRSSGGGGRSGTSPISPTGKARARSTSSSTIMRWKACGVPCPARAWADRTRRAGRAGHSCGGSWSTACAAPTM